MTTRLRDRVHTLPHRLVAVAGLGLLFATAASSQEPNQNQPRTEVVVTYLGANPKNDFALKFIGDKQPDPRNRGNHTRPVGRLHWVVPRTEDGAAGLVQPGEREFRTYCAEPMVGVVANRTYTFELQSPDSPRAYGLPDTEAGRKEAEFRARYIRELYGRFYRELTPADNPNQPLAFQTALWEIIFEGQLPQNLAEPPKAPFDLTTGTFQANYPNLAEAPAYVQTAQGYLKELTGDDSLFVTNQDIAGRDLVRMRGVTGMFDGAEDTPQSQLALQYLRGGTGAGVSSLPGAAGGGSGAFAPGGVGGGFGNSGFAGVGGGGGGLVAGNGSQTSPVGNQASNQTTPTGPPTNQISIPPTNQPQTPPPGNNNQPPSEQPINNNPVPAPAGLVLGVIAIGGALGGWYARRREPKVQVNGSSNPN